jgi:hypothetical protein
MSGINEDDEELGNVDAVVNQVNEEDEDDEMKRRWKESPFAVGLTKATWADEQVGCLDLCRSCSSGSRHSYVHLSAWLCRYTGAGRVGNMVVLSQDIEEVEDDSGRKTKRPRLKWIVGPYWTVTLCLTLPFFIGLSAWTGIEKLPDQHLAVVLTWVICNVGLLLSLCNVSCRDPGIMYRHAQPPLGEEQSWRWNDQALTYRPSHAKFDPECGVVIEHFDHTCPWTGTAIGKNNMPWFKIFLAFTLATILYDIFLLTLL